MKAKLLKKLRQKAKKYIYITLYREYNLIAIYNEITDDWFKLSSYDFEPKLFKDIESAKMYLENVRKDFIIEVVRGLKFKRDIKKYNDII